MLMRLLRHQAVRLWVEALVVVAVWIGLAIYNAGRTCSNEFGLPASCDAGWITQWVIGAAVLMVLTELAVRDHFRKH